MDTLYLVVAIGVIGYFTLSMWYTFKVLGIGDFFWLGVKLLAVMASIIYVMYFFLPKESAVDRRVREMEEEMAATLKFLGVEEADDADNK
jgi:hypothetical protein